MSLLSELQDGYIDSNGLVTPSRNSIPSDNGLLFTAQALMLERTQEMIDFFLPSILKCQLEPGLFDRRPGDNDQDQVDDYTGLATVSFEVAQSILAYGREHSYCWNNVNPGTPTLDSFLGRFPGLIGHMRLCAGETPSLWQRLAQAIGIVIDTLTPRGNTSNRLLDSLQIYKLDDHLISKGLRWWWQMMAKVAYGDSGIRGAAEIYFQSGHPFTKRDWP